MFDCNLETNHQILIIFDTNISDVTQLAIKQQFSFPPHPMYASAPPTESRSSEICVEINRKPEKTSPSLSTVT